MLNDFRINYTPYVSKEVTNKNTENNKFSFDDFFKKNIDIDLDTPPPTTSYTPSYSPTSTINTAITSSVETKETPDVQDDFDETLRRASEAYKRSKNNTLGQSTPTADTTSIDWNDRSVTGSSRICRNYLMQQLGLTADQASGLVGVLGAESNLNPNAENKDEKAGKNSAVKSNQYGIGIAQWTLDRHDNFMNWINQNAGGKWNDLKNQLDYTVWEIQNKYPEYLQALKSAENVEDATAYTYLMYIASNYKNLNKNNIRTKVQETEEKYAKKHKELGHNTSSGRLDRRVDWAKKVLSARNGAILNTAYYDNDKEYDLDTSYLLLGVK